MTTARLLLRSIGYYWKSHGTVMLGVVAACAVIGGALIVGDSVHYSLRQMSLDRLGRVDLALHGQKFFRAQLVEQLAGSPGFQAEFSAAVPAMIVEGLVVHQDPAAALSRRVGGVQIYGVPGASAGSNPHASASLWDLLDTAAIDPPGAQAIVLSQRVAEQLEVQPGDPVTLWIELPSTIPRGHYLSVASGKQETRELQLTVQTILDASVPAARFGLLPNQQTPLLAYVSLETLQNEMDLAERKPSRRFPKGTPARVNTILVAGRGDDSAQTIQARQAAAELDEMLRNSVELDDFYLRMRSNAQGDYLALESEQMILEDGIADAGRQAARQLDLPYSPVLVYLANEISSPQHPGRAVMYSVIAALDLNQTAGPPFGPFQFLAGSLQQPLQDNEIVVNDWLRDDLEVAPGDMIQIKYHGVGSHGELPELEHEFRLRGVVKLEGTPAADRVLTPEVRGITDVERVSDWEQPFPMKLPVPQRDEQYWDKYRATPKAFITLQAGQSLWSSRYGRLTSLRFGAEPGKSLEGTSSDLWLALRQGLDLAGLGMSFDPVKYVGLEAAQGTTDFTGLFFGFSLLLIGSAVILIGLLFRLAAERRVAELGLLAAVGYRPGQTRGLFLLEGLAVALLGGLLGTAAAWGYAWLMVYGLKTLWIGAIGTRFLEVYATPRSLAMGFIISIVVAMLAIWGALFGLRRVSPRDLLAGVTEDSMTEARRLRRGRLSASFAVGYALVALVILTLELFNLVPASEAFEGMTWTVVAFFLVGLCTLGFSLSLLAWWIDSDRAVAVRGNGTLALLRLGLRNAARNRRRSVLSAALVALASFLLVAVAAGHRDPSAEAPDQASGNGGFILVAEASQGIFADLNTPEGRSKLNLNTSNDPQIERLLSKLNVMQFQLHAGEDASCLNIYQTRLPTILGVPAELIAQGGFRFVGARAANPWTLLEQATPDGNIPVIGDMNTLMYSLHKGVGDTIAVPDARNPQYTLEIVGMLDGSIFQGVLLMSREHFQHLYPDSGGARYFLIGDHRFDSPRTGDNDPGAASRTLSGPEIQQVWDILETRLGPYGFDAERVADRLDDFLAVQNTYLSTFQTLGGLGLLLGTLGLATVMLRNVLERRAELALLRATGYTSGDISCMVVGENALLLFWGLASGTLSALLAMTPHILSIGADVPWLSVLVLLVSVSLVGLMAALAAVREAIGTPIIAALRSE